MKIVPMRSLVLCIKGCKAPKTDVTTKDIDTYIVSYYSIGDASLLLQTIKALDKRRSTGGWDLAANAILRNQFLDLRVTWH